ncbi:hypothetical protein EXT48_05865 [Pseudoalteromonas sp. CO348]|uniref:hypothetical protein n=1 Tax=Pseudoalteromonas sp. CO348 TaxID=1777271 RepID=UPI001023E761|nr:hypothetical protein [Pseudoalteromonas sp. CO348]RZG07400.1 hypothetical protein EXT48_05865 [Pseudoalteromonas sp. CO348]
MLEKLVVSVLGNRNSGKTTTWNTLFDKTVKTGTRNRRLYLSESEYVEVFLVSGSPEEREKHVSELITEENPRIVLCSVQYIESSKETFNYFFENEYTCYTQWLNPGHDDHDCSYFDELGLASWLTYHGHTFSIRCGKESPVPRVQEIKDFIYGWAKSRDLILIETVM